MWRKLNKKMTDEQRGSGGRPRRASLRLECLEGRLTPATFYVSTTLDNLTPNDGKVTLREAITKANERPGADVVVVPAGVFKIGLDDWTDDANRAGDFDIWDSVTIRGAGRSRTVIDGQQLDRVFHGSATDPINVVFQGMTIRNGRTRNPYGGGILAENANLTVSGCTVTGNRVAGSGGGIAHMNSPGTSSVQLIRSTVTNNVADQGSGGGV